MCNTYVPLHVHSFYSLLDGLSSPKQIAQRCHDIGCPACAGTDHGNIFGMIDHQKACKKFGIKPITGIELYISKFDPSIRNNDNKKHWHLTILSKNPDGIKDLMSLVSTTNRPDWFYRKPRIDLNNLSNFGKRGNLICLSGCIIGELSASLFDDVGQACLIGEQTDNTEEVKKLLKHNWKDVASEIIEKYQKAFGKENYFIELQEENMPAQKVVVECLREIANGLNIKSVGTLDAHYAKKEDADDHRILLYSQLGTTADEQDRIRKEGGDVMSFFYRDTFYIFSPEEMSEHYSSKEIEMSLEIADMITTEDIGRNPCIPVFQKSNEKHLSDKLLKELCIEGARNKLDSKTKEQKQQYWERLKEELKVIKEAGLADYFLIVWDICKFIDSKNAPRGKGRGSGAGCLINYLLDITGIDPLEYGLLFARFYNKGRNQPGHISLPDIDLDIGVDFRSEVLEYLNQKWGEEHISQMVTFGRLQGKAALKEVFRAQPDTVKHLMKVKATKEGKNPEEISISPFDLCNEITSRIPDEASIADELQQKREETDNHDYGILQWAIDNVEQVKEAYNWYKPLFDQAIRIEGTKKSQSKHAAGVVISSIPVEDLVPMAYDPKSKTRIVGVEMGNAEILGAVKFDLLGVAALDKLWYGQALINKEDSDDVVKEEYVENINGI